VAVRGPARLAGWRGLAAAADGGHAGCHGYELLSFGADGRRTAAERLPVDNPASAAAAAERDFGVDAAAWRPAYALLGPPPPAAGPPPPAT
jgi:hypothetical protein